MSLHKEASTEAVLVVFFWMERGTVSRYLKAVNGVLAEILPAARSLIEIIRGVYGRDGEAEGGCWTGGGATISYQIPHDCPSGGRARPRAAQFHAPGPDRRSPIIIGVPAGGNGIPGMLAGPAL